MAARGVPTWKDRARVTSDSITSSVGFDVNINCVDFSPKMVEHGRSNFEVTVTYDLSHTSDYTLKIPIEAAMQSNAGGGSRKTTHVNAGETKRVTQTFTASGPVEEQYVYDVWVYNDGTGTEVVWSPSAPTAEDDDAEDAAHASVALRGSTTIERAFERLTPG